MAEVMMVEESFGGGLPPDARRGREKLRGVIELLRRLAIHQVTNDGGVLLRHQDYAQIQHRLTDAFEDLSLKGPVN